MEEFVKGEVVAINLPFSDLSKSKRRPAFVLSKSDYEDLILLQITSKQKNQKFDIEILTDDFEKGGLKIQS